MSRRHPTLADRLPQLPMHQALLMVANELNRAHNMMLQPLEYKNALERALELLDLLSDDPRWRPKLRELRRAREMTAMLYFADVPCSTKMLMNALIQLDAGAWRFVKGLKV